MSHLHCDPKGSLWLGGIHIARIFEPGYIPVLQAAPELFLALKTLEGELRALVEDGRLPDLGTLCPSLDASRDVLVQAKGGL